MIDLVCAIAGREHCGWCTEKHSLYDRLLNANVIPWWWVRFTTWLGIWKLGRWWHWRRHV